MKHRKAHVIGALITIVFSLIAVNRPVLADQAQCESNAGVGFYGEYEEEQPSEKTSEPKKTFDQEKPISDVIPKIAESPHSQKPVGRLPELGPTSYDNQRFLLMGISMLLLVGLSYYEKERKYNE